jgi:hypothetical protein
MVSPQSVGGGGRGKAPPAPRPGQRQSTLTKSPTSLSVLTSMRGCSASASLAALSASWNSASLATRPSSLETCSATFASAATTAHTSLRSSREARLASAGDTPRWSCRQTCSAHLTRCARWSSPPRVLVDLNTRLPAPGWVRSGVCVR